MLWATTSAFFATSPIVFASARALSTADRNDRLVVVKRGMNLSTVCLDNAKIVIEQSSLKIWPGISRGGEEAV